MSEAERSYPATKLALMRYLRIRRHDFPLFVLSLAVLILGTVYVWYQLPPLTLYLRVVASAATAFFILVITHFLYEEIPEEPSDTQNRQNPEHLTQRT